MPNPPLAHPSSSAPPRLSCPLPALESLPATHCLVVACGVFLMLTATINWRCVSAAGGKVPYGAFAAPSARGASTRWVLGTIGLGFE